MKAIILFSSAVIFSLMCKHAAADNYPYPYVIYDQTRAREYAGLDDDLRTAIQQTGLVPEREKECVVFAYRPPAAKFNITIGLPSGREGLVQRPESRHPSGPPGSGFSMADLYRIVLWDRALNPSKSTIWLQYSPLNSKPGPNEYFQNDRGHLVDKGDVDANFAYTIKFKNPMNFAQNVSNLTSNSAVLVGRPSFWEQVWSINTLVANPITQPALDQIVHACLGRLPSEPNTCACVGTQDH